MIRGDLDPDPPLLEALPPLGTQDVDPRPLDQRRPGPHDPVPRREDLLAALPPAGRVADGPTIVKGQGRIVRSEVAAKLSRSSECPFEWSQRYLVWLARATGQGHRPEYRNHDRAHDEGHGERTHHRLEPPSRMLVGIGSVRPTRTVLSPARHPRASSRSGKNASHFRAAR